MAQRAPKYEMSNFDFFDTLQVCIGAKFRRHAFFCFDRKHYEEATTLTKFKNNIVEVQKVKGMCTE